MHAALYYKSFRDSFGLQNGISRGPVRTQVAEIHQTGDARISRGLREQPAALDIHPLQVGLAAGAFGAGQVKNQNNPADSPPPPDLALEAADNRLHRHPQG